MMTNNGSFTSCKNTFIIVLQVFVVLHVFFLRFRETNMTVDMRLVLLEVTLEEPANETCFFASWHGHKNGYNDRDGTCIKMDRERQKEEARILIRMIREVTDRHPFVIGGDFNLNPSFFPKIDDEVELTYNSNDIDYFVFCDFYRYITITLQENVERLQYNRDPPYPLDHQIVQARVELEEKVFDFDFDDDFDKLAEKMRNITI